MPTCPVEEAAKRHSRRHLLLQQSRYKANRLQQGSLRQPGAGWASPCDIILGHCCAGDHDSCGILDLHLTQENIAILGQLYACRTQAGRESAGTDCWLPVHGCPPRQAWSQQASSQSKAAFSCNELNTKGSQDAGRQALRAQGQQPASCSIRRNVCRAQLWPRRADQVTGLYLLPSDCQTIHSEGLQDACRRAWNGQGPQPSSAAKRSMSAWPGCDRQKTGPASAAVWRPSHPQSRSVLYFTAHCVHE